MKQVGPSQNDDPLSRDERNGARRSSVSQLFESFTGSSVSIQMTLTVQTRLVELVEVMLASLSKLLVDSLINSYDIVLESAMRRLPPSFISSLQPFVLHNRTGHGLAYVT